MEYPVRCRIIDPDGEPVSHAAVAARRAKREDPSSPLPGPSKPGCPLFRAETHSLSRSIDPREGRLELFSRRFRTLRAEKSPSAA